MILGKKCRIYHDGEADAVLIQPVDGHELELLDHEVEILKSLTPAPFTLAAFLIADWNRELSPWEAPALFGREDFGSGAAGTLSFITDTLLPVLDPSGDKRCYLGGYSLAGLFSLWASYQTGRFHGIAAVSPSVWFPGWDRFAASTAIRSKQVYLSLGDKEEKTRNQTMATVGESIRRQYDLLRNTGFVTRCELEWNPGNHFAEPDRRTAKGFAWLLGGAADSL